jgi:hypothetical protein
MSVQHIVRHAADSGLAVADLAGIRDGAIQVKSDAVILGGAVHQNADVQNGADVQVVTG